MAQTVQEFYDILLRRIGEMALEEVRPSIPSATLQDSLVLEVSSNLVQPMAVLFLPQFWAVFVHDGRGPVSPVEKTWLVWFQNPQDDPRTNGGRNYPVRASDVRRLTKAEWDAGVRENNRRRAAGQEPYMIVTKHSGPVVPPQSFEFFEKGMETFGDRAAPVILEEFDKYVRGLWKPRAARDGGSFTSGPDVARKTISL